MNYLLAKTKSTAADFYKVIDNSAIFNLPIFFERVKYNPKHSLKKEEWFIIDEFSEKHYCTNFLRNELILENYIQLPNEVYENITYLVEYQDDVYFFQKVFEHHLVLNKYISIARIPTLVSDIPILILNQLPDAIYVKVEDTLFFKNIAPLSTIFKGIFGLHKDATQKDTIAFLQSRFISLKRNFTADDVKVENRKRISVVRRLLTKVRLKAKKELLNCIREQFEEIEYDEKKKKFSVSNEIDLKKLLFAIEHCYSEIRMNIQD